MKLTKSAIESSKMSTRSNFYVNQFSGIIFLIVTTIAYDIYFSSLYDKKYIELGWIMIMDGPWKGRLTKI